MADPGSSFRPESPVRSAPRAVLDLVGSTWLGMVLLAAIFIYSSIGSAVPPVREGALADWLQVEALRFEKSEMGWFTWWPFQVLVGLFCLSTVVATVQRVPLNLAHAGAWMTHLGMVLLMVAAAVYFGHKIEGDTLIYRWRAVLRAAGMSQPALLVVRPGAVAKLEAGGSNYEIRVARIDPDYTLLSGPDAGQRTTAVWLEVTRDNPRQEFIRLLLPEYPQYTEDLVVRGADGWQRAVTLPGGQRLVDQDLHVVLEADPAIYYYHTGDMKGRNVAAVYARLSGDQDWAQFRFDGLPRYSARISSHEGLWISDEPPPPLRPLDIPGTPVGDADRLDGIRLRITDYLPCASLVEHWVAGGTESNPLVRFRLLDGDDERAYELLALRPDQDHAALTGGMEARFVWAASSDQRATWLDPPKPKLLVRVLSKGIQQEIDVSSAYGAGPVSIADSGYEIELRELVPSGLAGGHPAVALLRVRKGELTFDRLVIAGESSGGRDVDERFRPMSQPADADLKIEYVAPASPGLVLIGGDDSDAIDMAWSGRAGLKARGRASPGQEVQLAQGLAVRIEELVRDARLELRPELVSGPRRAALEATGQAKPLVRVEVDDGTGPQGVWLPFNGYAFLDERWAYPGRFGYEPREVELSDGRRLELLYSRCRDALPSPVTLEKFILETYPGGDRESDYISHLRLRENGGWSQVKVVRSNQPLRHGRMWYFQSQWDPGSQAYTVLGVGNREALGWMLAGVCISIAGMIWAFYVRPTIERRQQHARRRAGLPVGVGHA